MPKPKSSKLDNLLIGLSLGLVFPAVVMHFWLQHYSNLSLIDIIRNPLFSQILDILKGSLIVNLAIFFIFYWLKKDKSARGVVFATLLYALLYVFYKFLM